jgi:ubiquinone/menaquinone biosynthesis C-methylase UbiE
MLPFLRKGDAHALPVAMAGVRMGDHLLAVGCADGARLGAIALKVGLSGRAVAVVDGEDAAVRARKGAAGAGVLVDIEVAPATKLPVDDSAFDLAVLDDTGGLLAALSDADRVAAARELVRALKPGGRVVVIGAAPATGWSAALGRGPGRPPLDAQPILEAGGFRLVRRLAEREGLRFVEGVKAR